MPCQDQLLVRVLCFSRQLQTDIHKNKCFF